MNTETPSLADVARTLASLQAELAGISRRLAALEARSEEAKPVADRPRPAEELDEETIATIGAAIAAYLGKKAHIRQIQLLGSATWAQQGRVTIQASHALSSTRSQP